MKFRVRPDFVVHHTWLVEVTHNGETRKQPQTNSYYGNQEIEFTAEEAQEHLHRLEPADKEAAQFLAGRTVQIAAPVEAAGVNQEALAQAIADGVARALAALGVQKAPA